ncbi:hypothetical protein, partial [Escherichia coli]|uniref:hypothetical protein n=1 Tax=Escherichia coli TaxID=562 RepID=UPI00197EC77A
ITGYTKNTEKSYPGIKITNSQRQALPYKQINIINTDSEAEAVSHGKLPAASTDKTISLADWLLSLSLFHNSTV